MVMWKIFSDILLLLIHAILAMLIGIDYFIRQHVSLWKTSANWMLDLVEP